MPCFAILGNLSFLLAVFLLPQLSVAFDQHHQFQNHHQLKQPTVLLNAQPPSPPSLSPTTTTNSMSSSTSSMLTNISMNYAHPSTKIAHLRRNKDGNDDGTDLVFEPVNVSVRNVRNDKEQPTLHKHGVELVADNINVALLANSNSNNNNNDKPIDFLDNNDVMDRYYPLCEALLQKKLMSSTTATGQQQQQQQRVSVRAFDHNIRIAGSSNEEIKNGAGSRVQFPLPLVHGDYTQISAPRRIQDLAQPPKINDVWRVRLKHGESLLNNAQIVQEAAVHGKRRFALINVWRSIDPDHPVSCYPLACIDATTLSTNDLRTYQVHYADRIGENYVCAAHPLHEWIYFDQMTMDEALFIKQWDSHGDFARSKWDENNKSDATAPRGEPNCCTFSVHSACDWQPSNTPPRKSIEVRCVCIWDAEEQ